MTMRSIGNSPWLVALLLSKDLVGPGRLMATSCVLVLVSQVYKSTGISPGTRSLILLCRLIGAQSESDSKGGVSAGITWI